MKRQTQRAVAIHPDGTACRHARPGPGGRPPAGCPGRTSWRPVCTCGWEGPAQRTSGAASGQNHEHRRREHGPW
ncbi:hypothetical protein [Streptomyces calidiresistens]|uniref:Uncharacterized protein n=1 Tax=Streptomyces calidiresistens TaxID=1485586 RepID=A0A7W3T215_9ACTN|nr:hypothetical protein [Streptomyces calidiresistens]MBB0229487.1 hypothetical protein [Streptomyces calidiresistens]